MIWSAWAWLSGSRLGRLTGYIVAGLIAVLGVWAAGKREGAQRASEKARKADQKNAQEIEERVDEAMRKHDGDTRPVDERLRERGRLRDGD